MRTFRVQSSMRIVALCLSAAAVLTTQPALHAQGPPAAPCTQGSGSQTTCGLKITPARSAPLISPFQLDSTKPETTSIHFVSLDRMAPADQELLANSTAHIAALTAEQGFHVAGQGSEAAMQGWRARQAVCTALPRHLLMSYVRAAGSREEASFSVAIPRSGQGKTYVVPVERRGYSLYTEARRNRITMVVFNDLIRGDASANRGDWLGLGLCYAALAGDQIQPVTTLQPGGGDPHPAMIPASLSLSWKRPPEITFVGQPASGGTPLEWTLSFSREGTLKKVKTQRASALKVTTAKGNVVDLK